MRDIRLEEIPFEFDGKRYMLRCNMNVLADVQEAYGGDFGKALAVKNSTGSAMEFLAAMLNDYADEQGWPEHWTARQVGRKIGIRENPSQMVMGLVLRSITPQSAEDSPAEVSDQDTSGDQAEPGNPGN